MRRERTMFTDAMKWVDAPPPAGGDTEAVRYPLIDRIEDFEWLLNQGTPVIDSLKRTSLPTERPALYDRLTQEAKRSDLYERALPGLLGEAEVVIPNPFSSFEVEKMQGTPRWKKYAGRLDDI